MEPTYLVFDYETRSEADLPAVGAYDYAAHESTEILCVSWKTGTKRTLETAPVYTWTPHLKGSGLRGALEFWLLDPSVHVVAHNAFFEQVITKFVLGLEVPIERWTCSASLARAVALPGKLSEACLALDLPVQKDMGGHRLMLKLSKPRRATKNDKSKWHEKREDFIRLVEYCETDVEATTRLFLALPPLNKTERAVWELDQKINHRGFQVDRPLVKTVLNMVDREVDALNTELQEITFGVVKTAGQLTELRRWLKEVELVDLPDLTADTVRTALADPHLTNENAVRLLKIRQGVAKTSTKKYLALKARSGFDGRVRDMLAYHAASTGRWGGRGVQPQNFPRGTVKDMGRACSHLADSDLETLRLLYGEPMDFFSSTLRGMITASPGNLLYSADYAAIEARVLFWVAEHEVGIKAFAEDRPIYELMAAVIFDKEFHQVTKTERQLGKQAVLGCGYGMGWKKFLETCAGYGMDVDEDLAKRAVKAYRETHLPVPRLWTMLEKAAIHAVNSGKVVSINKTRWWVENNFLFCELPSSRRLAFYGPEIKYKETPWGEKKPTLYHYGLNSVTRKWESAGTYGGKITENVVQAIARDLMAEAMLRVEERFPLVLSIHDELLADVKDTTGGFRAFCSLMAENPSWAKGLPTKVEGWKDFRYKK